MTNEQYKKAYYIKEEIMNINRQIDILKSDPVMIVSSSGEIGLETEHCAYLNTKDVYFLKSYLEKRVKELEKEFADI